MRLILKSKKNTHFAIADYSGRGIIILPGSRINTFLSYDAMPKSVKMLRNNSEIVSQEGEVLKEVTFKSPSAAAQFVTGRSINGYVAWRIDDKISLKEYLKQNV